MVTHDEDSTGEGEHHQPVRRVTVGTDPTAADPARLIVTAPSSSPSVRLAIVCATGWFADTRDAAADRPLPGPQSVGCRSPVRAAARRLDLHGKP